MSSTGVRLTETWLSHYLSSWPSSEGLQAQSLFQIRMETFHNCLRICKLVSKKEPWNYKASELQLDVAYSGCIKSVLFSFQLEWWCKMWKKKRLSNQWIHKWCMFGCQSITSWITHCQLKFGQAFASVPYSRFTMIQETLVVLALYGTGSTIHMVTICCCSTIMQITFHHFSMALRSIVYRCLWKAFDDCMHSFCHGRDD